MAINFCGKKKKMMQVGLDKIANEMDIRTIINKLFEIEKLKYFLLDENQIKLFEYFPKPKISDVKSVSKTKIHPLMRSQTTVDYFASELTFEKKLEDAF